MEHLEKKLGDLEKTLDGQIATFKSKIETGAAELDEKHGISEMLEVARAKAKEMAASAGYVEQTVSDSASDSDSVGSGWGGDDPLKHRWSFRIDIPDKHLSMVVGARASVFILDPSTESGQADWMDAITGAGESVVAGQSGDGPSIAWLPQSRQPRTEAEARCAPALPCPRNATLVTLRISFAAPLSGSLGDSLTRRRAYDILPPCPCAATILAMSACV